MISAIDEDRGLVRAYEAFTDLTADLIAQHRGRIVDMDAGVQVALRDTPKEQIASWLLDRERAVERIRAKVASMRSGDDLVHVVALMRWEMVRLGIDTPSLRPTCNRATT